MMKYVTIQDDKENVYLATFSEELTHSCMAKGMLMSFRGTGNVTVRSAGFYYIHQGQVMVPMDKKSESLKLGPMSGDEHRLANYIGGLTALDIMNLNALADLQARKGKRK